MFVDDGSRDNTWQIIKDLAASNSHFSGISLSRNRGHQNALLAGLLEAKNKNFDITVSIDCDGQDDINAIDSMLDEYKNGSEIVYGVRSDRSSDTFFKRFTAESYYKILNKLGGEVIYNHADYRLVSSKVLNEFSNFKEVNLFLRGLFPLVGFKSSRVFYERHERLSGQTHYSFNKMLALALNGMTSLSVKPLRFIFFLGFILTLISLIASLAVLFIKPKQIFTCALFLISGVQLISLGIIGEYVGKIYLETKARPRFIVSERTGENLNA